MIPARRVNTAQQSRSLTVPAPVGGLNGRDSLAAMEPTDAYFMVNWVPNTNTVDARQGKEEFCDLATTAVQSLEVYAGPAGQKFLAFAGGKVFNITTGVSSQLATGKTSNYVIATNFGNSGGNYLICVTGADTPYYYDGTSIANLTMTVIGSPSQLAYVFAFKQRLYFAQKDKLGFWYLDPSAIQGAMTYFELAEFANKGGYLMAIASVSLDAGDGPNDYIAFITSMGEIILYGGYDPDDPNNWSIVGRYYTSPPIGRKCTVEYGTDLLIMTLDGLIPFSEIRKSGDSRGSEAIAITSKLGKLLLDYNQNADTLGWQAVTYAKKGWLIVNVPASGSQSGNYYQFVMNTKTNAWTQFNNWNALCFSVFNRELYFGGYDGRVIKADTVYTDEGADIQYDCKQAYNYFEDGNGTGPARKHFQWANLLVGCVGTPPISAKFNVDYIESAPEYVTTLTDSGAEWDTAEWDEASWTSAEVTQQVMATLNTYGIAGSLWLRALSHAEVLRWYATEVVFERARSLT